MKGLQSRDGKKEKEDKVRSRSDVPLSAVRKSMHDSRAKLYVLAIIHYSNLQLTKRVHAHAQWNYACDYAD